MGNKLKKAIRKATCNYTKGIYQTTLLGFQLAYDAKGRLITPNPNTQRGNVIIESVEYEFKKVNWIVEVYLKGELLFTIDTMPKYVKNRQALPDEKNLTEVSRHTELAYDFLREHLKQDLSKNNTELDSLLGSDTEWGLLR